MTGVVATNKNAFREWRKPLKLRLQQHNLNVRSFLWLQANYTVRENQVRAIKSVVFEKGQEVNDNEKLVSKVRENIGQYGVRSFHLDFTELNTTGLHNMLGLELTRYSRSSHHTSYYQYRLTTSPKNCVTCNIDALEISRQGFYCIQAAEIKDTSSASAALSHIIELLSINKAVAHQRYNTQYLFSKAIKSQPLILFYKTVDSSLSDIEPVLMIENNNDFHNMLVDIQSNYAKFKHKDFVAKYKSYLMGALVSFSSIYRAYEQLNIIYKPKTPAAK